MNIVDSSGWLEYFADGPNAPFFSRPLQNTAELIVPSSTIYEGVAQTLCRSKSAVLNMVSGHRLVNIRLRRSKPKPRVVAGGKPQTL
jgi:hypothetical protein